MRTQTPIKRLSKEDYVEAIYQDLETMDISPKGEELPEINVFIFDAININTTRIILL